MRSIHYDLKMLATLNMFMPFANAAPRAALVGWSQTEVAAKAKVGKPFLL